MFSSAGVGCYGFGINGFDCVATNELIERRLQIQKFNKKCSSESGCICGGITKEEIQAQAISLEKIKAILGDKEPKKVIYVPGKIVNIVV